MITGLVTEFTKLTRATVVRVTSVLIVLGISLICSSMLFAVRTDDPQPAAKLGPLVDPGGWAGYLAVAVQVTGAAGFIGYGVVLSWLFSREFADGTITGLFAIPVSRRTLAAAKATSRSHHSNSASSSRLSPPRSPSPSGPGRPSNSTVSGQVQPRPVT